MGSEERPGDVWERNAAFWDDYVGPEGNAFHRELVSPAQHRLLEVQPGERVLDVACGNGQFARELARRGAEVVAFDYSETFIERARAHTEAAGLSVEYRVGDATDESTLRSLGDGDFDAAVCTMALMDIASIEPIARTVRQLLTSDGRFVFSVMHPCFNSTEGFRQTMEQEDRDGEIVERWSVSVTRYIEPHRHKGLAMRGQPAAQNYFHRPLSALLGVFFDAGFVVDALEEPVFPEDTPERNRFGWLMYKDIPPVLSVRLRTRN